MGVGAAIEEGVAKLSEQASELLERLESAAPSAPAECDNVSTWCFPAGTPVAASGGNVPIEAIGIGNEVWAFDLINGQWRLCRVLQTFVHDHEGKSAFITVEGETIESTSGHPFWVVRGNDLGNRRRP